jgi:8-oxo-dGTP diphosphatase
MAAGTIEGAGGIVVRRSGGRSLIAVVQRSKDRLWVLPRGKLERNERPVNGARREVEEETGHRVSVQEYIGAIAYQARGRTKVVRFWRMKAAARPTRQVMKDIIDVRWVPLSAAVRRLSYPLEKVFLNDVGPAAIRKKPRS